MANNYTQFSFIIQNLTPAEQAWTRDWLTRLRTIATLIHDEDDETPLSPPLSMKEGEDPLVTTIVSEGLCVDWEIDDEGLWIYGEDAGDVEQAATITQRFLAMWRPKQYVTFTWADTCSKMRPDEFSGGGVLVTARSVRYCSASIWVARQRARLATRGGLTPA